MAFIKYILGFALLFSLPAHADDLVYAKENIANHGYDVVAYHFLDDAEPAVKGVPEFVVMHDGYLYYFSSDKNKNLFESSPNTYLPAYGGYCAFAISTSEKKVKVDPNAWTIVDGVLYLNYNKSVEKKWTEEQEKHITKADIVWPKIREESFKRGWF